MAALYWVTGAFALATVISMRLGRDPRASVVLTVITLVLFMITPTGQDVLAWVLDKGPKVAEGVGGTR